jgi:hypothetical protein
MAWAEGEGEDEGRTVTRLPGPLQGGWWESGRRVGEVRGVGWRWRCLVLGAVVGVSGGRYGVRQDKDTDRGVNQFICAGPSLLREWR